MPVELLIHAFLVEVDVAGVVRTLPWFSWLSVVLSNLDETSSVSIMVRSRRRKGGRVGGSRERYGDLGR